MARLPFVDTHVHFWDLQDPVLRYDWLAPEYIEIARDLHVNPWRLWEWFRAEEPLESWSITWRAAH